MSHRKLSTMLYDRDSLLLALKDYDAGKFAHLSEVEQAVVRSGIERRVSEIDAEIRGLDDA
jgi:hypothetical protein